MAGDLPQRLLVRWALAALMLTAFPLPSFAAKPAFVSCPSDGQLGPQPGPADSGSAPDLPASISGAVSYYAGDGPAVMAPSGWHCLELSGSSGVALYVTPEALDADQLMKAGNGIIGPAVELAISDAETSGRFEVARAAKYLFPSKKAFVDGVIAEGMMDRAYFNLGPFPHDRMVRRSPTFVSFSTPANELGVGTALSRFGKDGDMISGTARLDSGGNLVVVSVRLPSALRSLAGLILR